MLNGDPREQADCPDMHTASTGLAAERRKLGVFVGQARGYCSVLGIGAEDLRAKKESSNLPGLKEYLG